LELTDDGVFDTSKTSVVNDSKPISVPSIPPIDELNSKMDIEEETQDEKDLKEKEEEEDKTPPRKYNNIT
jgi:hypothetical protein